MKKKEFISAVEVKLSETGYFYNLMFTELGVSILNFFKDLGIVYDNSFETYDELWDFICKSVKDEFKVASLPNDVGRSWLTFYKEGTEDNILKDFEEFFEKRKQTDFNLAKLTLTA